MTAIDNSTNGRSDGEKIVDIFLQSQDRTPLSSGSALQTARAIIEAGIDLGDVAEIDLRTNGKLFDRAYLGTLSSHKRAGASRLTSPTAIKGRLADAFTINKWVAIRVAMSAALHEAFEEPVRVIKPDDPRMQRAREILATEEGRAQAIGILSIVIAEASKGDGPDQPLHEQYQAAQKGQATPLFPKNDTDEHDRDLIRERLMLHYRRRLGRLATYDPYAQPVIKTFLNTDLDPVSLELDA